jgi:hypothetical protein
MPKFEWDENKNKSNQKKHKVPFEDAIDVFNDDERVNYRSDRHGETRFKTLGKALLVIMIVIYTVRDAAVRIISARRATKKERRTYLTKKLSKNDDD